MRLFKLTIKPLFFADKKCQIVFVDLFFFIKVIVPDKTAFLTIAENREECSFIWDNYYYEEERINEYELSLFIREGDSELYRKYQETHFQKAYDLETMKRLITQSGLEYITAYDAFTKEAPTRVSERIYVIARERGK